MEDNIYNLTIRMKMEDIDRLRKMGEHMDKPLSSMGRFCIKRYLRYLEKKEFGMHLKENEEDSV